MVPCNLKGVCFLWSCSDAPHVSFLLIEQNYFTLILSRRTKLLIRDYLSILQIEEVTVDGERRMSVQKKAVEIKVILFHALQTFKILSQLLCKTKPSLYVFMQGKVFVNLKALQNIFTGSENVLRGIKAFFSCVFKPLSP